MAKLKIPKKSDCMWDLVSLGEVMLRLDPGDERISTTRQFRAWEGGGEYNVARDMEHANTRKEFNEWCADREKVDWK